MKKYILFALSAAATIIFFYAFSFINQNFQGVRPSIESPKQDITEIIEKKDSGKNETDFPLKFPSNYNISIFEKGLKDPRVIIKDPKGAFLVSTPSSGEVVALKDNENDGKSDVKITVANNLNRPHGLALNCEGNNCNLYVGETNGVAMFTYDLVNKKASNKKKIIDLPSGGGHWTRSLLIHENKLFTSIGSSCNVCLEDDSRRAKIYVSDLNGGNFREYATGLRNSVFMKVNPKTNKIWATEMGRDLLGDDIPPDEINIIEEGKNYGWPNCFGKNIHDTNFDKNTYIRNPCSEPFESGSHIDLQAHSAPLGLEFWNNDLLVSFHGSWNRSIPTGYKIVKITLNENGEMTKIEDFISGWLQGSNALGRPVDILADGKKLYITDDRAGVIYKIE